MRVADFVIQYLKNKNIKTFFSVTGRGSLFLNDALARNKDVKSFFFHHEQSAAIAAEAYGRIQNNIGVAIVTSGPGSTNAITGLLGAWIESVPLMIISGQVKTSDLKGNSGVRQMGPQEVDIVSIVKPITKYATTVKDPTKLDRS